MRVFADRAAAAEADAEARSVRAAEDLDAAARAGNNAVTAARRAALFARASNALRLEGQRCADARNRDAADSKCAADAADQAAAAAADASRSEATAARAVIAAGDDARDRAAVQAAMRGLLGSVEQRSAAEAAADMHAARAKATAGLADARAKLSRERQAGRRLKEQLRELRSTADAALVVMPRWGEERAPTRPRVHLRRWNAIRDVLGSGRCRGRAARAQGDVVAAVRLGCGRARGRQALGGARSGVYNGGFRRAVLSLRDWRTQRVDVRVP